MKKEIVSKKQIVAIIIMFLLGSNLVIGISPEAKQDGWISSIMAFLLFTPMAAVYIRIINLFPGDNLYQIIAKVFGNFTGKLFVLLYTLYSLHVGALVMRNFSEFISIVALPLTPQIVLLIFLLIISVAMVKSGVEALGRWSKYIFPLVAFVIISTFLIGLKDSGFSAFKPIGGVGIKTIMSSAFTTFSFPFAESVLILPLFSSVSMRENTREVFFRSILICLFLNLVIIVRNLTILGVQPYNMLCFPSYSAVSVISIGDFFTRFEVLIGMTTLLAGFIKICVCLFAAVIGISGLMNFNDYKPLAYPAGLLMLTLAVIIYRSSIEMFDWVKTYRYYALPFQVIMPIIIWLGAELKKRAAGSA